ncbi:Interleukin-1 receptor-associated kinase 4 [Merluccius polli]|uniref:non-specific serine/threonine protein kinase n=1 Tax=Merluccius polli TaxID=89951 RepID=A0AA47NYM0_MERPO|nr:Interleukin-1 receptor-associated kinase 4 [Merluccius polli]
MNRDVTPTTYIRRLDLSTLRRLADFLDPDDRWRDVVVSIRKPSGEPRYTQLHVRRFASLAEQGKSPTIELLTNWGTTNATVGELVDILKSNKLMAPAALLLPGVSPTSASPSSSSLAAAASAAAAASSASSNVTGYLSFSYQELVHITGNFDDRPTSEGGNRLGEGGFGTVYKGFVDHKPVAVKKLSPEEDILVEELRRQFQQEIQTLKTLKHQNLVDMVGFSCDGDYPCLVYVYMANGSVLDRLACMPSSVVEQEVFDCHRERQSGNILLDENFVAKISDFGLTRASATRSSATVLTERIVGTRAYMAPEALRGEITPKSDVFSFGVVLLEILSGLPPVDESRDTPCLMELRYDIDDEDEDLTLADFLDKKMSDMDMAQAERTYSVACNCLNDRKARRPTIKQVLSELEDVSGF